MVWRGRDGNDINNMQLSSTPMAPLLLNLLLWKLLNYEDQWKAEKTFLISKGIIMLPFFCAFVFSKGKFRNNFFFVVSFIV